MSWFDQTIVTIIICLIGLAAAKDELYQTKNFKLSSNINWSFNPSKIVAVEPPFSGDDKYTYVECDESNENTLKFNCQIVVDKYYHLTLNSKKCYLFFDKEARNEIIDAVQLKSIGNGKFIVSQSIKTVETITTSNQYSYIKKSDLSKVKVYVVDYKTCEVSKSNVNFLTKDPANFVIAPLGNTFEIISVNEDLPQCKKNYCIFKFDAESVQQIEEPLTMLLDKLYSGVSWQLNVYPIDSQSLAKGYLVIARYTLDGSLSKVFIVKPNGSNSSPELISNFIEDGTLTNSYHWYKYNSSILLCAYKFTEHVISCSKIDENLHVESSVNLKLDHSTSLRSAYVSSAGEIILATIESIKDNRSYHKLYITSESELNNNASVYEFVEKLCYPKPTYYSTIVSHTYENKNEICISNYCNNWSVKCISTV